ncbi:MAG: exodeoxyribonuclease III [Polyangiales bacterium]
MKIATWNINSVRAREERLLNWLTTHKPDVLCLQELKVPTDAFPTEKCKELGYHSAVFGQKTYNGVAILTREEPEDITRGMDMRPDDEQSRLISVKVSGVRIICAYFPNGGNMESDKWVYKQSWMDDLATWIQRFDAKDEVLLTGDFNVAPFPDDIARPDEYEGSVLANPIVREKLEAIAAFGLEDVFRPFHPGGNVYTWWDYRGLGFERNNGMRIDHFYATKKMADRVIGCAVERSERHGKGASDHAPVLLELQD